MVGIGGAVGRGARKIRMKTPKMAAAVPTHMVGRKEAQNTVYS